MQSLTASIGAPSTSRIANTVHSLNLPKQSGQHVSKHAEQGGVVMNMDSMQLLHTAMHSWSLPAVSPQAPAPQAPAAFANTTHC
eukprot:1151985-Pelagomonas_calceolata.AAC.8